MNSNETIACNLSAIPAEELENHKENGNSVLTTIEEYRELADGYALRLPTETEMIEQAGAFMARERLCCPFFQFKLEIEPNHGPVWLKMTGNSQVKQYLAENIISQIDTNR